MGTDVSCISIHRKLYNSNRKVFLSAFPVLKPKRANLNLSYNGSRSPQGHYFYKQMLHTKFQGNPTIGSGEDFLKVFLAYIGISAILVM